MKAFDVVGIGIFDGEKWVTVVLSVQKEMKTIPNIPAPPQLGNGITAEVVSAVMLQLKQNPERGFNPIIGFVICESRENAVSIISDVSEKMKCGDFSISDKKTNSTENIKFSNN